MILDITLSGQERNSDCMLRYAVEISLSFIEIYVLRGAFLNVATVVFNPLFS